MAVGDLTEQLIACWPGDEASGDLLDAHSSYDGADVNTVGSGVGVVYSTARNYVRASTEYHSVPHDAALNFYDTPFTIGIWVNQTDKATNRRIITKWEVASGRREWWLSYISASDRYQWEVRQNLDGASQDVLADSFGSPPTGVWTFILVEHDPTNDLATIQVNDGVTDQTAYAGGLPSGISPILFGANSSGSGTGGGNYLNGLIGPTYMWNRLLNADEKTWLYNSGDGRTYQELLSTQPAPGDLTDELIAFWPGTENSLDAPLNDAHTNGLDLANVNGVDWAEGNVYPIARHYTEANGERHIRPGDDALLSLGADSDFTLAAWAYFDSLPASGFASVITGKRGPAATEIEYAIYLFNSGSGALFRTYVSNGTAGEGVNAATLGIPSTGRWYFAIAWYDTTSDTLNIQINNGTVDNVVWAGGTQDGAARFCVGSNSPGGDNLLDGRVGPSMFYKRILTADERTWLYNGGAGRTYEEVLASQPSPAVAAGGIALGVRGLGVGSGERVLLPANNLLNNLVAMWPGDEASGDLLDAHTNGLDLTDVNTVTSNPGHVYSTARQYTVATIEHHSHLSNALLQMGDIDFTVAAWVYLDSIASARTFVAKDQAGSKREYNLMFNDTAGTFRFLLGDGGATVVGTADSSIGTPSTGAWYLVIGWHDAANNNVLIQVNDGTPDSVATTGTVGVSDEVFMVGDRADGSPMDGRIGPSMMWKSAPGGGGVLTEAQRTALWNDGNGLKYEDFTGVAAQQFVLASYLSSSPIFANTQLLPASLAARLVTLPDYYLLWDWLKGWPPDVDPFYVPTNPEFDVLYDWLNDHNMAPQEINAAIGTGPAGRNWLQIAIQLMNYLLENPQ